MPLKVLEQVIPWFAAKLNDAEAASFLQNMQLAGLSLFNSLFALCLYNMYIH